MPKVAALLLRFVRHLATSFRTETRKREIKKNLRSKAEFFYLFIFIREAQVILLFNWKIRRGKTSSDLDV